MSIYQGEQSATTSEDLFKKYPTFSELAKMNAPAKLESPVPTDAAARKKTPVWSGFVKYFPRAIVKISQVSQAGNDQHNPAQELHWAKEKSRDHFDTALRHLIDHLFNPVDTDGQLHLAKAGWRILAALETYLEEKHAS